LTFLPIAEPLKEDIELREFGLDSIDMVELLTTLESAYSVRFMDEDLKVETFATPATLWRALDTLRSERAEQ
jgi:acyl carrier protein